MKTERRHEIFSSRHVYRIDHRELEDGRGAMFLVTFQALNPKNGRPWQKHHDLTAGADCWYVRVDHEPATVLHSAQGVKEIEARWRESLEGRFFLEIDPGYYSLELALYEITHHVGRMRAELLTPII